MSQYLRVHGVLSKYSYSLGFFSWVPVYQYGRRTSLCKAELDFQYLWTLLNVAFVQLDKLDAHDLNVSTVWVSSSSSSPMLMFCLNMTDVESSLSRASLVNWLLPSITFAFESALVMNGFISDAAVRYFRYFGFELLLWPFFHRLPLTILFSLSVWKCVCVWCTF